MRMKKQEATVFLVLLLTAMLAAPSFPNFSLKEAQASTTSAAMAGQKSNKFNAFEDYDTYVNLLTRSRSVDSGLRSLSLSAQERALFEQLHSALKAEHKIRTGAARSRAKAAAQAAGGDTCAAAPLFTDSFSDTDTTIGATDDLVGGNALVPCTPGYFSASSGVGPDKVYRLQTGQQGQVDIVMDPTGANDLNVAVVTDCANLGGSCITSNDQGGTGTAEAVSFLADAGVTYFIIVDGFDGDAGPYTLDVTVTPLACDDIVVNGTLGSGSPDWPSTSGQQTPARIFRDGIPSSCAAPKVCPGTFNTGSFTFDAYTFTNESSEEQCITILFNPDIGCGTAVHGIAYLNSYDPTNLCLNYLADVGSSVTQPFSFTVPAGADFIVAVVANNAGVGDGCAYEFTVRGNICAGFDFCVQQNNNPNQFIQFSSTTGAYVYRDCSKNVTIEGVGIVTQSFCKIQLTSQGADPKKPDRLIDIIVNPCTNTGNATVRVPSNRLVANISDSNIMNNTCACAQ